MRVGLVVIDGGVPLYWSATGETKNVRDLMLDHASLPVVSALVRNNWKV